MPWMSNQDEHKKRTFSIKVLTRTINLGLGLLEYPVFETSNWARQLKSTGSPTKDWISENSVSQCRLIADSSDLSQFLPQCTFAINVQIITREPSVAEKTKTTTLFTLSQQLVAIVAYLGIGNAFLVILPKSLDAASTLVPIPHIVSPSTLDASSHIVPVSIAHRFQSKQLRDMLTSQTR